MPGNYKKQPRTFNPRPPQQTQQAPQPQTDELEEEAKWNPTPEIFEAFLVRDEQLATGNILMVLTGGSSYNVKGLKDCTLHSSDTIERVLTSLVASGQVTESKGRYSRSATARVR